jgi:hypothetical protein
MKFFIKFQWNSVWDRPEIKGHETIFHTDGICIIDRLCGLLVIVPGYRSRDPRFDFRRCQIFWEVMSLERGPLSLVSITEELLEWKSSGSGSRKPRLTAVGTRCADHATRSILKSFRVEESASEESAWTVCSYLFTLVPSSQILLPWKWRRYDPPKRRFTQELYGATTQKRVFFNCSWFL